jgi:hypothetical protein
MATFLSLCGSGTETGYAQEYRINRFLKQVAETDEERNAAKRKEGCFIGLATPLSCGIAS